MMPDTEDDEMQERLWKRRRKEGRIYVGSLIKVKGEIREKWKIRKIKVMKLGCGVPEVLLTGRYSYRSKCRDESLGGTMFVQATCSCETLDITFFHIRKKSRTQDVSSG